MEDLTWCDKILNAIYYSNNTKLNDILTYIATLDSTFFFVKFY